MKTWHRAWWGIAIVGGILSAAPAVYAAPPTNDAPTEVSFDPKAPPKMLLTPQRFYFGETWESVPAEQEFTIKNVGKGDLSVRVRTSCGCTPVSQPKSSVAPGESTSFKVSYDTTRVGPARRKVTVMTNDPTQKRVVIPVEGVVRGIFKRTPKGRVVFPMLEVNEKAEKRVLLENRYKRPVKLRLKDGHDTDNFKLKLNTLNDSQKYELVVMTDPPLRLGSNRATAVLETDVDICPEFRITIYGNAQPRVLLTPPVIAVHSRVKEPMQHLVRVQYRTHTPVKIKEVLTSLPGVKYELLPQRTTATNAPVANHEIRLTVPGYEEIPESGGKVVIVTDDEDYKQLELPIMRRDVYLESRKLDLDQSESSNEAAEDESEDATDTAENPAGA